MGQAKSRGRARRASPSSQIDLTLLPQELLELILSWVPDRILVTTGRLVCRQWRNLIDSPVPWKLQAERDPSRREAFLTALEAAPRSPRMERAQVGVLQPFGRNLIRNPPGLKPWSSKFIQDIIRSYPGEEPFYNWQVKYKNGGCMGEDTLWISQLIDLVKEGLWEDLLDVVQPDIFISDWWGTHEKSHRNYSLCILLLAVDKESVVARYVTEMNPEHSWNIPFQQASHVFRKYGPGACYLLFRHIHNCPRAEPTEADISNSTVLVKLPGETDS